MMYLVCEMEYREDFSDDTSARKPIRVIQMVNTIDRAKLLVEHLDRIEGYCEETGAKCFDFLEIK